MVCHHLMYKIIEVYILMKHALSGSTSGLVVKSDVAIVGPRVRFSAGALFCLLLVRHQYIEYGTHIFDLHFIFIIALLIE